MISMVSTVNPLLFCNGRMLDSNWGNVLRLFDIYSGNNYNVLRLFKICSGSNCSGSYFVRKAYSIVCVNSQYQLGSTCISYSMRTYSSVSTLWKQHALSGLVRFRKKYAEVYFAVWCVIYIAILKFCNWLIMAMLFRFSYICLQNKNWVLFPLSGKCTELLLEGTSNLTPLPPKKHVSSLNALLLP
jgi:hypothetical protein